MALAEETNITTPCWNFLLPEVVQHLASFLSVNEVACSLRPLCRSWASALNAAQHKTVRLSLWSPYDAFAAHWGAPGALRSMTPKRKGELVRLTAATGSVQNLELAAAVTGCDIAAGTAVAAASAGQLCVLRWLQDRGCDVLDSKTLHSAIAGGHLVVCAWLRDQGCPFETETLVTGAETGRLDVCAWLLAHDCPWDDEAVSAAAEGGHVVLLGWLLWQRPAGPDGLDVGELLEAAARGCPLPVLQLLLCQEWVEEPGGWLEQLQQQEEEDQHSCLGQVVAAAAASSTPCWQAKVTWLQEEKGYPLTAGACEEVIRCCPSDEEALARLMWLRGRGCEAMSDAINEASSRGRAASLSFLLAEGVTFNLMGRKMAAVCAAGNGHLACVQAMHAAGVEVFPGPFAYFAARGGHLPVVRWLVETPRFRAPLTARLAAVAAESGSLELLSYLHERGCPWDVTTWKKAVEYGSEEMQEWLRERGCPTEG